jgi:tetratricopeptide (TPR) repeat protein
MVPPTDGLSHDRRPRRFLGRPTLPHYESVLLTHPAFPTRRSLVRAAVSSASLLLAVILTAGPAGAQDAPAGPYATAMNVAYAARQRGDSAAARDYFTRATLADSTQAAPYIELGYLELSGGNKAAAARWFEQGARRAPSNADVRRQLAYVFVDLRQRADAIRAFESIAGTPGGYTDRDRLALAYLYDADARNREARAAFRAAAQSVDTAVSHPARRALRVKGDVGTVWFSEGYVAPFYQTRFQNAIGFGFLRHGIEGGSAWAPALYTSLRVTRDSKSTAGAQSQVLSDNAAIAAGGVRLRPWHGPVWLYAEAGSAFSLLSGDSVNWRRDLRGGAYLIAQDERPLYSSANWKLVTDVVADVSWYERFDRNVIGYALLREGVRVGTAGKVALDVFGRGWLGYDSRGDFFNRAAESGGGMALRVGPNFVLFGEGLYGRFFEVPPAGTKRRYQDWRITAVWGWRALKSVREEGAR